VVLDGYDLGAGALHLLLARTPDERRQVLGAIGPYWDGNEVWLLALGGTLFVGFPSVLAAALSGFYLAIFMILWCLIGRGISIEVRSHVENDLWRSFWDVAFAATSALLALLFGVALGNLVRGVPLDDEGWFSLPLFGDFGVQGELGLLDWYTCAVGLFAVLALAAHGAAFLAWKTADALAARARRLSRLLYLIVGATAVLIAWLSSVASPSVMRGVSERPGTWLTSAIAIAGLVVTVALPPARDRTRFIASSAFLVALLASVALTLHPALLHDGRGHALTAAQAASPHSSLEIAARWLAIGLPLAVLYFALVFRIHRGRVASSPQ
jgi:cytochrome d ubiquinol oxidase subunit II